MVDALTSGFGCEVEHVGRELVDGLVYTFHASIDNVDTIVGGVLDQFFHVASKTRKIGRYAGNAHHCAFCGGVAPGLVIRCEDSQVSASHEFVVVHWQDGIGGVEKFGVEHYFDAVRRMVEELNSSDLVKNWIFAVAGHVMRDDRRQGVSFHGEEATTEEDTISRCDELLFVWHHFSFVPFEGSFEHSFANPAFDNIDCVSK